MTNHTSSSFQQVPVIDNVDVLVVGSSSGAVAAALAAREQGASVLAVSDRSYFGEESAGALRLGAQQRCDDPLFQAVWPDPGAQLYPGTIKHRLEKALLQAQIPFLFYVRPIALLRAGNGTIRGVVLAARTSLYAVGCRSVVDASRQGLVARLAGVSLATERPLPKKLELVMISPDIPQIPSVQARTLETTLQVKDHRGELIEVVSHVLTLDRPGHEPGVFQQAGMEHRLRSQLRHATNWGTSDVILDAAAGHLPAGGKLADDPLALGANQCQAGEQIYVLSSLLPVSARGAGLLDEPAVAIPLGRQVGAAAAGLAGRLDRPTDWAGVTVDTGVDQADAGAGNSGGVFGFATGFVRPGRDARVLELDFAGAPVLGEVDVVVAGGGTGGAPAGISAARAGARTVVLEKLSGLGGVGTLGLIASYYHGNIVGFTEEVNRHVHAMSGGDPADSPKRTWNPYVKDTCYQHLLAEAGGAAWFSSFAFGVQKQGDRVVGVLVSTPFGSGLLRTAAVVDATGSADVAAAAGAPCRVIDAHHVAVQGTGLSPRNPGRARNTDHNFIDDNDPVGVTHAFVNARAKFPEDFDVSPLVNSRERRQIHGEVELSPLDFLAGRTFPDTITTARSNFDSHGFTVHPVFLAVPPDKQSLDAHVPFRCMLPQQVEGVLVTGLGMSAHRDALPVVRMQADVQNQGYAAGLAAARSAATGQRLRDLDIRELQRALIDVGVLAPDVVTHEDSFPLPAQTIQQAVATGAIDQYHAAVLVAHQDQSLPGLRQVMQTTQDAVQREQAALLLGLFGQADAAEVLAGIVSAEPWDEGWNYRGMGQFGRSMSRIDGLVVALGKSGSQRAVEPVLDKIQALDASAVFSHCRAVSVAASALADPRLSQGLAGLLNLPGMQGHAHLCSADVIRCANNDPIETEARNLSLRELLLARGLYLCGDVDGLGKRILETYARDLRGAYARHAQAVLGAKDVQTLRTQVI